MTEFATQFLALEASDQDRLRDVVSRLMRGEFITPGSPLRPDRDWGVIERMAETIDAYLAIGGWRLEYLRDRQIARVVHPEGAGRLQFDRLTTSVLILLRRVYHEHMGAMVFDSRETQAVTIAVADVREQLMHVGWKHHQVSRRLLENAIRSLHRAQIITIERGFEADDRESLTVLPVIEAVLPIRDVRQMQEHVERYVAARGHAAATGPEDDAEASAAERDDAGDTDAEERAEAEPASP